MTLATRAFTCTGSSPSLRGALCHDSDPLQQPTMRAAPACRAVVGTSVAPADPATTAQTIDTARKSESGGADVGHVLILDSLAALIRAAGEVGDLAVESLGDELDVLVHR